MLCHVCQCARRGPTFNPGDVNLQLAQLFAGLLNAFMDRLHDLLGVLLHPSDLEKHEQKHLLFTPKSPFWWRISLV